VRHFLRDRETSLIPSILFSISLAFFRFSVRLSNSKGRLFSEGFNLCRLELRVLAREVSISHIFPPWWRAGSLLLFPRGGDCAYIDRIKTSITPSIVRIKNKAMWSQQSCWHPRIWKYLWHAWIPCGSRWARCRDSCVTKLVHFKIWNSRCAITNRAERVAVRLRPTESSSSKSWSCQESVWNIECHIQSPAHHRIMIWQVVKV